MNKKQIIRKLKKEKNRLAAYGLSIGIIATGITGVELSKRSVKNNINSQQELDKEYKYIDLEKSIILKKDNKFFFTKKETTNNNTNNINYKYIDILTNKTIIDVNIIDEINNIIENKKNTTSFKEYSDFSELISSKNLYKTTYKESELKKILSSIEKDNNNSKIYTK